jgi:hypothetical protein
MRYLFWFYVFINSFSILKKKSTDSIAYYTNLADSSIKENKYKARAFFTQKAINYCDNNGKLSIQNYKLGKIYYDLNKYSDARDSL